MIRSLLLILSLAVALPTPVQARDTPGLCASAKSALARNRDLAEAAAAAFPRASATQRDTDCIYPLQLLRYADADVLISTDSKPGEACHGCAANLSADVLRRLPGRQRLVARFERFGSEGTFGDPGRISALQLAGNDAFALESGGMFQGYSFSSVTFYAFHDGRLVRIKPNLSLSASDEGARPNDATSVEGAWHATGGRSATIVVDYEVSAGRRRQRSSATWNVVNDTLVLKAGRVPRELESAAGK